MSSVGDCSAAPLSFCPDHCQAHTDDPAGALTLGPEGRDRHTGGRALSLSGSVWSPCARPDVLELQ